MATTTGQSFIFSGRLFQSVSDIVFVMMLVLMSNGYTIVRGKLSAPIYIALTVFTVLFTLTYAVLFIYEAKVSFLIFLKVNN